MFKIFDLNLLEIAKGMIFLNLHIKMHRLKSLVLVHFQLNPFGYFNWSSLVSLSTFNMEFIDVVVEKVLSGYPNLEYLELD